MQHMHNLLENTVDVLDIPQPAEFRYRAATVDQAVADATSELGRDVEVIQASRIRRGGVGGFFATDLGVEIVVSPSSAGSATDRSVDVRPSPAVQPPVVPPPAVPPAGRPGGRPYDRFDDLADELAAGDVIRHDVVKRDLIEHEEIEHDLTTDSDVMMEIDDVSSFARHFAREMALEPAEPSPEVGTETSEPSRTVRTGSAAAHTGPLATPVTEKWIEKMAEVVAERNSEKAIETKPETVPEREPEMVLETEPETVPEREPEQVIERVASTPTADVPEKIVEPRSRAAKPRVRRDPLRRPTELVAGAIDSLVTRLSATSPADGSRLNDLHRLSVTITTSDGDVIEMAAELQVR